MAFGECSQPVRVDVDVQRDGTYVGQITPEQCPGCSRRMMWVVAPILDDVSDAAKGLKPWQIMAPDPLRILGSPVWIAQPCGCELPAGVIVRIWDAWPLDWLPGSEP